MSGKTILLAAGGTGGHLFPAEALGAVLSQRGQDVALVGDLRVEKFSSSFPGKYYAVPSATPRAGGVLAKLSATWKLGWGTLAAVRLLRRLKPGLVVGFGGYPTVPPVMAAHLLGIPTLIHEQNAVMGKANRFLARKVSAIACGFPDLKGTETGLKDKLTVTGNPVRPSVLQAATVPYPGFGDDKLHLMVTGGSQGAKVMSDVVPAAVALLELFEQARLVVVQQARGEDEARVKEAYRMLNAEVEVKPFFNDLPQRMAAAHLVVARSGASTVSELAVIGRPAILVPFPFALDQDQAANAAELAKGGAVEVIAQKEFTPEWLASRLRGALNDPLALAQRASEAKTMGRPEAAEKLADLVLRLLNKASTDHKGA